MIRNVHIIMSPEHRRWLAARELLCSQGFPAFDFLIIAATAPTNGGGGASSCSLVPSAVCSFNLSRESRCCPPRHRTSMSGQAGDSMNVNMIGAALVQQLAFTVRLDTVLRRA